MLNIKRLIKASSETVFLISVFIIWVVTAFLIVRDQKNKESKVKNFDKNQKKIEIIFWHAMGGPLGDVMNDLINRYNKIQDKYYVKSVNMGNYDTLEKKILASVVANSTPDISQNYESLTKKLIKAKKIVCLDDLIAREKDDIKSDIHPVLLKNNTYNNKLWSFPFNKSVPVLYYNKDLFFKAGLDPNKPPQTLDELASYARYITNFYKDEKGKTTVIGFGTSRANVWMFLCRVLQYGGKLIDEESKKAFFDQQEAINALKFIIDMTKEGIAIEGQGFDHQNDFKAQKVAMIEGSIVSKKFMESGIKFDMGIAPLPKAVVNAVVLSGTNINIFKNDNLEKVLGAWEFVKWFTSTDISAEWSIRTSYIPVRVSALQSNKFKEAQKLDQFIDIPYKQLDYAYFEPRIDIWYEIRDLIADYLEEASLEKGSPQKYLIPMNKAVERLLSHVKSE